MPPLPLVMLPNAVNQSKTRHPLSQSLHFMTKSMKRKIVLHRGSLDVCCLVFLILLTCMQCMMLPLAIDAAWSLCLSVCVCLLVSTVSCTKAAEPVQMPFGMWTWVGQGTMYSVGPRSP